MSADFWHGFVACLVFQCAGILLLFLVLVFWGRIEHKRREEFERELSSASKVCIFHK
jgi:hypothetical protein